MKYQKWNIADRVSDSVESALSLPNVESTILYNRGIDSPEKLQEFLFPQDQSTNDPFLFEDMEKVVKRLSQALDNREIIGIFGDFDTDGLSGTACLLYTSPSPRD